MEHSFSDMLALLKQLIATPSVTRQEQEVSAIMKADMDYLKAVIKMNMDKSLKSPSLDAGAGMSGFSGNAFSASSMPDVSVSAAPAPDMSVDVAI